MLLMLKYSAPQLPVLRGIAAFAEFRNAVSRTMQTGETEAFIARVELNPITIK